jgi:DNA-binding NarL/FixJ family response regulator
VGHNLGLIQADDNQALTGLPEAAERSEENGLHASAEAVSATPDEYIAVIESRTFIGECIRRSMMPAFPLQIQAFSDVLELQKKYGKLPKLILISELEDNKEKGANVFESLSRIAPDTPVVVLASTGGPESAKAAISHGAQGYIPITLGLDVAIEAVRFVLAGGTYVPIDYLLMSSWQGERLSQTSPALGAITPRELAVVRAIQRGKSNKVIAYELGMCESTVKVHVRRVMKKLNAKNRTDVAIKSQTAERFS